MKTVVDKDLFYTVQMWPVNSAVVDFKTFHIVAVSDDGPEYVRADSETGTDWTTDLALAQVFCSGGIKWDGCINLKFDEQETVMLHFCDNPGNELKSIMDLLYRMAAEFMPEHKDNLT